MIKKKRKTTKDNCERWYFIIESNSKHLFICYYHDITLQHATVTHRLLHQWISSHILYISIKFIHTIDNIPVSQYHSQQASSSRSPPPRRLRPCPRRHWTDATPGPFHLPSHCHNCC